MRIDSLNPYWIDDLSNTVVKDGSVDFLTGHEITFWNELIKKYLLPLPKDEEKEVCFLSKK